jgi:hypothetical protein
VIAGTNYGPPPKMWTSWRDRRLPHFDTPNSSREVTVLDPRPWYRYLQPGLTVEHEGRRCFIPKAEFAENFTLIYDPYVGAELET